MFRYLRSTWKTVTTSSKTLTLIAGLLITSLSPMIISPTTAHADTANCDGYGVKYAATSWLTGNGNGVNICNPGPSGIKHYCLPITGDPVGANCPTGSVWSGDEWQCVEMVNRLYLTKGWTTATWYGDGGNGNALTNSNNLPNGITAQANGSISYVNPGDVISENNLSSGHAAIINSIDSNGTLHIKSQNADLDSSATLDNGTSLSAGNAHYSMVGWVGYTVRAIAHHPTSNSPDNTVLQVKKITQSDGTNEVIWSKATDVDESWWNSSSNGIQVSNLIHIAQGDIKSFDISLYSNGEHDLFTATAHNIWETWWFPGQSIHTTQILTNIGNIRKVIKSMAPDGMTNQLYVLTDTGAYEYWWNSGSNGIQHDTIMTLANPVDEYKEIEADGTQALFVADQNYPYEQHWGSGINGIQQTTFSSVSGITSISYSQDSDHKHRLYIGASSGAIWEASWYSGSIGYWYMTGGAPVVSLQKWEDDSEQVMYEATAGGVFEYYWPTTSNSLGSDTIVGSLSNVHAFVRSTDPSGVQSVYTATGTNILESWWIPGGNGITTGTIE